MDRHSDEILCYSLEEVQERVVAALADADRAENIGISIKRLGGYRLLVFSEVNEEPTPP